MVTFGFIVLGDKGHTWSWQLAILHHQQQNVDYHKIRPKPTALNNNNLRLFCLSAALCTPTSLALGDYYNLPAFPNSDQIGCSPPRRVYYREFSEGLRTLLCLALHKHTARVCAWPKKLPQSCTGKYGKQKLELRLINLVRWLQTSISRE